MHVSIGVRVARLGSHVVSPAPVRHLVKPLRQTRSLKLWLNRVHNPSALRRRSCEGDYIDA